VPPSTLASVITAIAVCITAIGGVIAALTLFIPILRNTKNLRSEVQEVHTIVNQQRTDAQNYQRALIRALNVAGVAVPDDQSLPPNKEG
jgi:hypothetical protein